MPCSQTNKGFVYCFVYVGWVFFLFVFLFWPLFYDCLNSIRILFAYQQIIWKLNQGSCYLNDRYLVMIMPSTEEITPHQWMTVLLSLGAAILAAWPCCPGGLPTWDHILLWRHHFKNYMSKEKHILGHQKSLSPLCKGIITSE